MSKDKAVVLDLETKKTFDEVGGREHLGQLGVTVVGLYDYGSDEYRIYEEAQIGSLQNCLINASLIIGFNNIDFDLPVLQPYLSIDVKNLPTFDILADLQKRLGHRIGLDSVAQATLGIGKTGNGLDAIRFYREGRMEELRKYCLNDVKVTKEVWEHGTQNGKVYFISRFGRQKKEVQVDWKKQIKQKLAEPPAPAQYKLF